MNLKCLICSDLLSPASEIFGTTCGHLFHYHCLIQWIERSKTCPQCRSKATERTIFKIYLTVEENAETTDVAVLHNKLDNLQFQINLKNLDVKNLNEKSETLLAQTLGLKEENKEQENKLRVMESAMFALKEQVTYFKAKSKDAKKLMADLQELQGKLERIKNVELVLAGTQDEVNSMLRSNQDPRSLSILVATLKKELIESDRSKRQLKGTIKTVRTESLGYRKKFQELRDASVRMREELENHKGCETERQYLKSKLAEFKNKYNRLSLETANSVNRIVSESPIPNSRLKELDTSSPSVPEVVETLAQSNSPYLRVQTSSIGLSGLLPYNNFSTGPNKNSMLLKQHPLQRESLKRPSISYDGLGGHSKDEEFPSPRSSLPFKKPKISVTTTARKFKKLAPQPKLSFQKHN